MSGSLLNWRAISDTRRRKASRGRRESAYTLGPNGEFNRDAFEAPENLMVAYRILEREGGHAPGVDGLSFGELSGSEVYSALREISSSLHNGTYRPNPHRAVQISKSNGKFRTLHIPTIFDRTVSKALQLAVQPRGVVIYSDLFKDPWTIFAEIEREIRDTGNMYLITADITDCFPSIHIDDVLEAHRDMFENPFLLRLIEQVVRGHEGREKTKGLSQGDPYSPLAAEVTLRHILAPTMKESAEDIPSCWRYVDNIVIASQDAHEGQRSLQVLQDKLGNNDLTLRETGTINLNQPQTGNANILGLTPRWTNNRLTWEIPGSTWNDLEETLANYSNHPDPEGSRQQTLEGMINSLGPALMTADIKGIAQKATQTAQEQGTNRPNPKRLTQIGTQARQNWLDLRSRTLKELKGHPRSRGTEPRLPSLPLPTGAAAHHPPRQRGHRPR
jgi:retron-type reverse transcriptase